MFLSSVLPVATGMITYRNGSSLWSGSVYVLYPKALLLSVFHPLISMSNEILMLRVNSGPVVCNY